MVPAPAGSTAPRRATPHHRFTSRREGDLAISSPGVEGRRAAIVAAPWTWLRQVHGARVVTVRAPGEHAGAEADAAVTSVVGAVVAVQAADCAPVVLLADDVVGVAHAGWRGLAAGVLPATVRAMRSLGASEVHALLGPCIHPCCYEFGSAALASVSAAVGATVAGTTTSGELALDVPAAVSASLAAVDVELDTSATRCTSCEVDRHWSHRARAEPERQAGVAWLT